jgi:coenzyme F420-0:L-glutamate ligase/coenzyme F420-1:gamma-L-glutamate ligase
MDYCVDLLKKRRSIRKYSSQKVGAAVVREVLDAARWAPSAHNAQPWRFIVLTEGGVKRSFVEAMAAAWKLDMAKDGVSAGVRENKAATSVERLVSAPVLVVACLTMRDMARHADELRQNCERDLAVQSLGAALQNMFLVAHAKGLGACWFSAPVFCKETVQNVLRVPEDVEPQALIALGYPAETPKAPDRKPLESYVYSEFWGKKSES